MKSATKKTKKGDHVRLRALNGLLYKALTDLLSTPEVSQETYDLNVELCKVGGVVGQSCLNRKRRPTPRWSFSLGFRSDGKCGHFSTSGTEGTVWLESRRGCMQVGPGQAVPSVLSDAWLVR